MRDHRLRSDWVKRLAVFVAVLVVNLLGVVTPSAFTELPQESLPVQSVDSSKIKKTKQSLYTDVFDQAFYEEGVQFLRLGNLFRKATFSKSPARNVNVYDEVPDSLFFTNRQARERLSEVALRKGSSDRAPAPGRWTVARGKMEGVNPGFFIRDSLGQEFLLKFDPIDYPELASASETISSRLFHAIGYNVPGYHVVSLELENLDVDPRAKFYDDTGFKKQLTREKVEELLLFVAKSDDGTYRASASAILPGEIRGPFSIDGYRREDPNDPVPHRYRREVRALRVFASWVDYYDLRSGNTLDMIEPVNGKSVVRHYMIDFGSTLGSAGYDAKPPQFGHEFVFDFGEFFKSLVTFGFREKPWQKRWDQNKRKVAIPSVGYFDNREFNPGKWKNQMPYHAFKDLTSSDAYWAAKIVMAFRNEDVAAVVDAGELSDPNAEEYLVRTLTQRRDAIGRYWFARGSPLDWFRIARDASGFRIDFTDLAVHYGLETAVPSYRFKVCRSSFRREGDRPSLLLEEASLARFPKQFILSIQVKRAGERWSKRVCVTLGKEAGDLKLLGIEREP